MAEWKLVEGWAGGWWDAICPTSTLGWAEIQMKIWRTYFFPWRWPPSWTTPALQWRQSAWSSFAGRSILNFQLHLEYYFSYFLSYSEAAVLAFSVTPGYFNPPHFWIWTGDFTFTSTFSFANEILFSPLPLFSGDPLLGGTHVHFISFMSKFHLFVFRWQLTFSLWCLLASLLSPYGGPSRWWPSFSSSTLVMFCWCRT